MAKFSVHLVKNSPKMKKVQGSQKPTTSLICWNTEIDYWKPFNGIIFFCPSITAVNLQSLHSFTQDCNTAVVTDIYLHEENEHNCMVIYLQGTIPVVHIIVTVIAVITINL